MPAASNGCVVCARHASTTDGAAEVGDVENRAGPLVGGHRCPQYVIGQSCHHPHAGVGFPCQQRDFEVCRVVIPGADHGAGAGDLGVGELGGVGELDDVHAGVVELLDDRRRQRVVAADDDMATHPRAADRCLCGSSLHYRGRDRNGRNHRRFWRISRKRRVVTPTRGRFDLLRDATSSGRSRVEHLPESKPMCRRQVRTRSGSRRPVKYSDHAHRAARPRQYRYRRGARGRVRPHRRRHPDG